MARLGGVTAAKSHSVLKTQPEINIDVDHIKLYIFNKLHFMVCGPCIIGHDFVVTL